MLDLNLPAFTTFPPGGAVVPDPMSITAAAVQSNVRPSLTIGITLPNDAPVAGRLITVYLRKQGQTDWVEDGTATTGPSGSSTYQTNAVLQDGVYEFYAEAGLSDAGGVLTRSKVIAVTIDKPNEAPVFADQANLTTGQYVGYYDFTLWIGATATAGTVVGRIATINVAKPLPVWSLTGAASSFLSVDAGTGLISVSSGTVPAAGTYTLTVGAMNSVATVTTTIQVHVVANADLNYQFIDGAAGSDTYDGSQPHQPRLTLNPSAVSWDYVFFKRGSTNTGVWRVRSNAVVGSYGDMTLPIAVLNGPVSEDYTLRPALDANNKDVSVNNTTIQDIEITGGRIRCASFNGMSNPVIRRTVCHNNLTDTSDSKGWYLRACTNLIFIYNSVYDTIGDAVYLIKTAGARIEHNTILSPSGHAGDCLQITDEGKGTGTANSDIIIRYNVLHVAKESNSIKGAAPLESQTGGRLLFEFNEVWGKYFAIGTIIPKAIVRRNIAYGANLEGPSFGIGNGADFAVGQQQAYANIIYNSKTGMRITGFDEVKNGGPSTGWPRVDIEYMWNIIHDCPQFMFIDRPTSGRILNNLGYANADNTVSQANYQVSSPTPAGTLYSTFIATPNFLQDTAGPTVTAEGTITGTVQDGQTVSVGTPPAIPAGCTIEYHWCISGRSVATGTSYAIPANTHTQTQDYMPQGYGLGAPELSCVGVVKDVNLLVSLTYLHFGDGSYDKAIVA